MIKNSYEIYPKNLVAQNMVFQNMSNHYRRLYNAKPRIDTRRKTTKLPACNEPKRTKSRLWINSSRTPSNLDEVDQKRSSYRQCCAEINVNYVKCQYDTPNYQPRILKTTVDSKVRNLQVYHPPRRRLPIQTIKQLETQPAPKIENELNNEEEEEEEEDWIRNPVEKTKTNPSKPCSSDSAYTEEGEVGWSGGESRGATPIEVNTLPSTPVLEWTSSQRSYRSDDLLYVKFLREITEEVLRKGVFTNRALKQIFQDHIKANKNNLDMVRMEEEIEKLRIELTIPKEDYLNDVDFGLGSDRSVEVRTSSSEIINFPDKELLDALNQLDISDELRADVANSLGLRPSSKPTSMSRQSSLSSPVENHNLDRSNINHVQINRKDLHINLHSSDEEISNGYEESSECSESSHNTDGTL